MLQGTSPLSVAAVFLTVSAVAHGVAQNILNKAELAFVNSNITNVGEQSFVIVVNSQLSHAGSFDATLNGVSIGLQYQGKHMANCLLPPINIKAGHKNEFTLHSLVHVEDQAVFDEFASALMTQRSQSDRTQSLATRSGSCREQSTRVGGQRRPNPPTLNSTLSDAHGMALSLSWGIGRPEVTHNP